MTKHFWYLALAFGDSGVLIVANYAIQKLFDSMLYTTLYT